MRVGISLLHHSQYYGTGVYTGQLLAALGSLGRRGVEAVRFAPSGSPASTCAGHPLCESSSLSLRWPFAIGADLVSPFGGRDLDLVHYPSCVGPPITQPPIVATLHDVSPFVCREFFPWDKAAYLRLVMSSVCAKAALILADSRWQARKIRETLPWIDAPIEVLYPCCDPAFNAAPDPMTAAAVERSFGEMRPYALSVGVLEPRKNPVRLIQAWSEAGGESDLILAGQRGWKYAPMLECLNRLGEHQRIAPREEVWKCARGRRVRWFSHLAQEELAFLYRHALCLFYPSLFEGFGLPVLEAMGCGCPVLTSLDSPMQEIAGEAAWLCNPHDLDSMMDALKRLLEQPGSARDKAALGRQRASQHTLAAFTEGLLGSYLKAKGAFS